MPEKDQVEALRLLREWMEADDEAKRRELRERTERFLNLEPESHGQRRG